MRWSAKKNLHHAQFGGKYQTERQPRVPFKNEKVFKRERNVTLERGLSYGRKQREHETFENLHVELIALTDKAILSTLLKP